MDSVRIRAIEGFYTVNVSENFPSEKDSRAAPGLSAASDSIDKGG